MNLLMRILGFSVIRRLWNCYIKTISGVLTVLWLCCPIDESQAQCPGGEVMWQYVEASGMRCGRPGYVTNDTYYRAEEIISVGYSSPAGLGTATSSNYQYWTYTGPTNNGVCGQTINCNSAMTEESWSVDIPFTNSWYHPV